MSTGGSGLAAGGFAASHADGSTFGTRYIIAISIAVPLLVALCGGVWYYRRRRAAKQRARPQVWRDTKRVRRPGGHSPLSRWLGGVKKPAKARVKHEENVEDSPV
ncbi:hypothetical protein S7711_10614 [Stachybotrys chartarum IBT 7711]|uniref:Uncharacterized protein n=1 Tax=Stachybotrys chartarum (strain CBS 109288 / IBT 7711) TaxID=1280523 RepID=A0A084AZ18_STACB|nr:hypothetical protein S7711_10614 [Stachybotrys chartarum IBT 7711]KFA54392.1 hypothetical protein S40293_04315 [Stachybotrys chartarum IBT 40293]